MKKNPFISAVALVILVIGIIVLSACTPNDAEMALNTNEITSIAEQSVSYAEYVSMGK